MIRVRNRIALVACLLLAPPAVAAQQHGPSPYAGTESREIKSLSEDDLDELRRGGGWGLALAAELNGVPGPAHLLELKDEIGLDAEQVAAIAAIHAEMRREAQAAGARLIAAEEAIESAFRRGGLDEAALRSLVEEAGRARADLRFVHLSRHLSTPPLLTAAQIEAYRRLRGYAGDPCAAAPQGHDAAMWRRHNGCR